jgi:hypothetical protein
LVKAAQIRGLQGARMENAEGGGRTLLEIHYAKSEEKLNRSRKKCSYVVPTVHLGSHFDCLRAHANFADAALLRRSAEEDRADHRWCWVPENGRELG